MKNKQEREQVSVRIDKALMDAAYERAESTGTPIKALMDRAVLLAVAELIRLRHSPLEFKIIQDARHVLRNEGVALDRLVMNANVLRRFPELALVRGLSSVESALRNFCIESLEAVPNMPGAEEVMKMMMAEEPNRGRPKKT
jgi:hypothetical protein